MLALQTQRGQRTQSRIATETQRHGDSSSKEDLFSKGDLLSKNDLLCVSVSLWLFYSASSRNLCVLDSKESLV
jgi:hypothetical protein